MEAARYEYPALVAATIYVTGDLRVKLADAEGNRVTLAARHGWLSASKCGASKCGASKCGASKCGEARRSQVRESFPG